MRTFIVLILASLFIISCEKDVTVKVPEASVEVVVEGYIESGVNPYVILSNTLPFFGEIRLENLLANTIEGATVIVSDGITTDTLDQIPGIGVYTTTNMPGVVGKTYNLTVIADGKVITAVTTIPNPVPLDSVWWKVDGNRDSLGFARAQLTDPDTLGNCYRWFAKRINRYTTNPDSGEVKDSIFIAPQGSAFEDRFINGRTFPFNAIRGTVNGSDKEDDTGIEQFFFKRGDTIVVKFCALDRAHFDFWRTEESQVGNNGNPFGSIQPVKYNINGGLGIWGGYSPSYDTIIAQ